MGCSRKPPELRVFIEDFPDKRIIEEVVKSLPHFVERQVAVLTISAK